MPRFFVETADPGSIAITGEDARHIGRSLRMRPGERLTVCCDGMDYDCEITQITADTVFLRPMEIRPCAAEPSVRVTLYQAVPKQDKLAEIIQKTVELGVTCVVPVLTSRCVARPTAEDFGKKLSRLQKIAAAAAKQSGRGVIPRVEPLLRWQDALSRMEQEDAAVMLYEEEGGMRFGEVPLDGRRNVGILIGSEGGFSPEEAQQARDAGLFQVWLGSRILRCETAPAAALSILMYLTKNL